jgi:hypothetical protein
MRPLTFRLVTVAAVTIACLADLTPGTASAAGLSANAHVFATGFNDPRGLHFGPDGALYVAEGGLGGSRSTVGQCTQVPPPVGPYTGGDTARISRVDEDGGRSTVIDGLLSTKANPAVGGDIDGVADVAWIGGKLFALTAGGGCSHGNAGTVNGLLRINHGVAEQVANLSAFIMANPTAHEPAEDFEPDGTWYGMVRVGNTLYATEPNHSEIDVVAPDGSVRRLVDMSAEPWVGPTALVYHRGSLYVGNLSPFPAVPGAAKIFKVDLDGTFSVFATGLTTVLGVAFDRRDRLYALESFTSFPFPAPPAAGSGKVVRLNGSGSWDEVVTGLNFPTAMTFGKDGYLYISNCGYHCGPGGGQIVRASVAGNSENDQG